MRPVNADRYERDVVWRTCEPGPGQSNTDGRGQNATWMGTQVRAALLAGERFMRESKGKSRSQHACAPNATAYRLQTRVRDLCPLILLYYAHNQGSDIIYQTSENTFRPRLIEIDIYWNLCGPSCDWTAHVTCPVFHPRQCFIRIILGRIPNQRSFWNDLIRSVNNMTAWPRDG